MYSLPALGMRNSTQFFDGPDTTDCDFVLVDFLISEDVCLEVVVVEAVEQEIQQIRNDCLSTFRFQQI